MVISEIHLVNFESHKDSRIPLAPGITAIIGRSDSGKSSIARALRWLIQNEPRGEEFIRRGEKRCEVSITFEDGTRLSRVKGGGINSYVISIPSGEETRYDSIGLEVPSEVYRLLGTGEFCLPGEDQPTNLNFAHQGIAPMGIMESGPERARRLNSFARVDKLDLAIRNLTVEARDLARDSKAKRDQITKLQERIVGLGDLEAFERATIDFQVIQGELTSAMEEAQELESLEQQISRAKKSQDAAQEVLSNLASIQDPQDILEGLLDAQGRKEGLLAIQKAIKKSGLDAEDATATLEKLKTCQTPVEEELNEAYKRFTILSGLQRDLLGLNQSISKVKKDLENYKDAAEKLTKEYTGLLQQLGTCPVCFQEIEEGSIAEKVHTHVS